MRRNLGRYNEDLIGFNMFVKDKKSVISTWLVLNAATLRYATSLELRPFEGLNSIRSAITRNRSRYALRFNAHNDVPAFENNWR